MENDVRYRRRYRRFCMKVWFMFNRVIEGFKRQKGEEVKFKEKMVKFFLELIRYINLQI